MSSVPSSMIVRSAVKLVSNTLSKPARRRAVFISNVTGVPGSRPNSSPMAERGAGAVWMTTCVSGSSMAAHTASVSSLAYRAPTGQRLTHWPQLMQTAVPSGMSSNVSMVTLLLRPTASSTPTSWMSMQVRMQRRQRMHLFMSRMTL